MFVDIKQALTSFSSLTTISICYMILFGYKLRKNIAVKLIWLLPDKYKLRDTIRINAILDQF